MKGLIQNRTAIEKEVMQLKWSSSYSKNGLTIVANPRLKITLLGIFFWIVNLPLGAQESIYCTPSDYTGSCYIFSDSVHFKYSYSSCTFMQYGEGLYDISKDTITFNFCNPDSLSGHSVQISKTNTSNSILILHINLKNTLDSSAIIGAAIQLFDNENKKVEGVGTDFDGFASFDVAMPQGTVKLQAKHIRGTPVQLLIDSAGIYDVTIYMNANSYKQFVPESKDVFRIHYFTSDSLAMSSFRPDAIPTTYYRKQSKANK